MKITIDEEDLMRILGNSSTGSVHKVECTGARSNLEAPETAFLSFNSSNVQGGANSIHCPRLKEYESECCGYDMRCQDGDSEETFNSHDRNQAKKYELCKHYQQERE